MMAENTKQDSDRMAYYLEILARLQERGLDIATVPLTIQTVQAVLGTGDEIINEELAAGGLGPMKGVADNSFETLQLLSEEGLPAGALTRVEIINEANEAVCFEEFFQGTANGDARTWDEYMNRGNARTELGRFDGAVQDYNIAEALAERPNDKAMVRRNRVNLLRKIDARERGEEKERS